MKCRPYFREFARLVLILTCLAVSLPFARGALSITIGTINLQPDQANQPVEFMVSNDAAPTGVMVQLFRLQVEDGETATSAPTITSFDAVTGTIFDGNTAGDTSSTPVTNKRIESSVVSNSGTLNLLASSRIATVTFDTTGILFGEGPFAVSLTSTGAGGPFATLYRDPSNAPISPGLNDGQIVIVPESSVAFYLAVAFVGMLSRRTRRR